MTRSTPQKEQVGKFRKKPVEVEAIRWTGDNIEAVLAFMAPHQPQYMHGFSNADDLIGLGESVAVKGDWIIKDADGNLSVRSPKTFEETYEPA